MLSIAAGFIGGVFVCRAFSAWFARESAAIKATIATEIEKFQPDIQKVKTLLAKL